MTDTRIVTIVVCFLGLIAFTLSAGALWMFRELLQASEGKEQIDPAVIGIFTSVTTLAGVAIGGLGAILVSTKSGAGPPAPVQVVNAPADPVPVEPAP